MPSLKAIKRNYTFIAPGKIGMVENLAFLQKIGTTVDYAYSPGGPEVPWEISSVAYEPQKAVGLGSDARELRFRTKPSTTPDINTMIAISFAAAPIPTETGFTMDFRPQCHEAPMCEVSFSRLPVGATVQLLAAPKDAFSEPAIVATRSGESTKFESAELRMADRIRVTTTDAASRNETYALWNQAGLMTRIGTEVSVSPDGIVQITSAANILKGEMRDRVAFFKGPVKGLQYQVGRTQNVTGGYMSEYVEPDLRLEPETTIYGYSLMGAIFTDISKQTRMVVPLSARVNVMDNYTLEQKKPGYIATHEKISLRLPAGFSAKPRLFECLDYALGTCSKTRFIAADIQIEGQIITLHPREAQISGLWLLTADITGGQFDKPGLWTRFTFGLAHYHKFGKDPRWAFWFWFLIIIGSLVAAIVGFVWLGRIKRRRLEAKALQQKENQVVQDLLKRDPAFDLENFRTRAKMIAEKIQHAWSAGDMRECRRFLSQGVYNRFRLQLKIMREHEHRQNAMADFHVLRLVLVERRRSGAYDAIIVRLDAEARDTMVDAGLTSEAARAAAQKAPLSSFTEYYTLVRKRTAKTEQAGVSDACSHCGTPFTGEGEITKCKSCGAVMGSGNFDWVLAEITQQSEYSSGGKKKKLPNDLSSDRIEDRASFVFWRYVMSRLTGERGYVVRDATEQQLSKELQREALYDIAVGAAEFEAIKESSSPLKAKVRIKWSAAETQGKEVRHKESILTLVSEPDDAAKAGFAEHSCASCGAPLPETDSIECSYCHSPLQGKNADWLLESVDTHSE